MLRSHNSRSPNSLETSEQGPYLLHERLISRGNGFLQHKLPVYLKPLFRSLVRNTLHLFNPIRVRKVSVS